MDWVVDDVKMEDQLVGKAGGDGEVCCQLEQRPDGASTAGALLPDGLSELAYRRVAYACC